MRTLKHLLLLLVLMVMPIGACGCEMSCRSDDSLEDAVDEVGDEIEDVAEEVDDGDK